MLFGLYLFLDMTKRPQILRFVVNFYLPLFNYLNFNGSFTESVLYDELYKFIV